MYGKSDCECYIHNASEMSQFVCFVNVPLRPMLKCIGDLRTTYMLHFDFLYLFLSDIVAKQTA